MRRAAAAVAVLGLLASGCAVAEAESSGVLDSERLVIGTSDDQPGIGLRTDAGGFEGFDIDVSNHIAKELGFAERDVRFVAVEGGRQEEMISSGEIDLLVAFYPIRPDRKLVMDFAGPYYEAHQDILVRKGENQIDDVRDLQTKQMCDTPDSGAWERITLERKVQPIHVTRDGWAQCIDMLRSGEVEAVSTIDAILAGYLRDENAQLKFVNAPFTDERIGIGVPKGDHDTCEAINRVISEMYKDGTMERLFDKWFGETGLVTPNTVPQFEGCE